MSSGGIASLGRRIGQESLSALKEFCLPLIPAI
jgi:hypothetical protein